jgi:hypothetical protein
MTDFIWGLIIGVFAGMSFGIVLSIGVYARAKRRARLGKERFWANVDQVNFGARGDDQ